MEEKTGNIYRRRRTLPNQKGTEEVRVELMTTTLRKGMDERNGNSSISVIVINIITTLHENDPQSFT